MDIDFQTEPYRVGWKLVLNVNGQTYICTYSQLNKKNLQSMCFPSDDEWMWNLFTERQNDKDDGQMAIDESRS